MVKAVVDVARDLGKALTPPEDNASGKELRTWRLAVVGTIISLGVGLGSHIALACGLTPFYAGFAGADDVREVAAEVRKIQLNNLVSTIPAMKKKHCEATDPELRGVYLERLNAMLEQYTQLKGQQFPMLSCEDVR